MKPYPGVQKEGEHFVHFIQFLLPNGGRLDQWIPTSRETWEQATALWEAGFSLEIENQMSRIWMSVVRHTTDEAVDWICQNGPDVPVMVADMIQDAFYRFLPPPKHGA